MFRRITFTLFPLLFLVLSNQDALAQRLRLETRIGINDGAQTTAKYEQRNQRRKLNVELEDMAPRTRFVVQIRRGNRRLFSRAVRTNGLGVGVIDLDTTEGNRVARLREGDRVIVRAPNGATVSGRLRRR